MIIIYFLWGYFHSTKEESPSVVVAVAVAKNTKFHPSFTALGDVVSDQGVDVSSKSGGMVSKIYFQSGQLVKKGDLLVELENSDLKAQLAVSKARLNLSQAEYERYKVLVKSSGVSHSDFDKRRSEMQVNQAQVDYETASLEQTQIRAPFDGKLGIRKINLGQYISPGQVFVNLQALFPLYVDFNVPEAYISELHEEANVTFKEENSPHSLTGKVVAVGSQVDLQTRTLAIRALIENTHNVKVMPGMYVQVQLALGKEVSSIEVPQSAISYGPLGEYVYTVLNHEAHQKKITTGDHVGDKVMVLQGLTAGELVVCAGQNKLHPGVNVNTTPYVTGKQAS